MGVASTENIRLHQNNNLGTLNLRKGVDDGEIYYKILISFCRVGCFRCIAIKRGDKASYRNQ